MLYRQVPVDNVTVLIST